MIEASAIISVADVSLIINFRKCYIRKLYVDPFYGEKEFVSDACCACK